ncbi:MAG: Mrp/NBP35 family ATP-binding protein [Clostridia bacterium]|nr:Mrp/NBP35 family ATP-binding protein [Clostridia bacterium]
MSECTHDCSTCQSKCSDREEKESLLAPPNSESRVKHVIGVVSGKGGVGKSMVASMLAVAMQRRGYQAAILDADITGPSIPRSFGISDAEVSGTEAGMIPPKSKTGIEIMSVNLLIDEEAKPVVWRGPVIAGVVKQFWSDVVWNDVDYMFVDMPPGTGDVPLTVFQSLPLDGIIIVGTPQELVSMIVEKAVNMAKLMNIRIFGMIENMSYLVCPDCGERISIYGETGMNRLALSQGLPVLERLPIDTKLANMCDTGTIELMQEEYMQHAADVLEDLEKQAK